MNILFCSNPLDTKNVDYDWEHEATLVNKLGGKILLLNYEELISTVEVKHALKLIKKPAEKERCIYRGWMLPTAIYEKLYQGLLALNLELINSPSEYEYCYYLPASYQDIAPYTPKTLITNIKTYPEKEMLKDLLSTFGDKAIIIKDYVKSQKHHWHKACYIPKANDTDHALKVINTFIKLQAENFQGSLVFREFIELESVGIHPKSNMPLTKEYRVFIKNKKVISTIKYWDEVKYVDGEIALGDFISVFNNVKSNFFTVDIAKCKDGRWIIIELGDGQVAEHMGTEGLEEFYQQLLAD